MLPHLKDLSEKLKQYDESKLQSTETAEAVGADLGWLESMHQAEPLVRAVREHYSKPNVHGHVSVAVDRCRHVAAHRRDGPYHRQHSGHRDFGHGPHRGRGRGEAASRATRTPCSKRRSKGPRRPIRSAITGPRRSTAKAPPASRGASESFSMPTVWPVIRRTPPPPPIRTSTASGPAAALLNAWRTSGFMKPSPKPRRSPAAMPPPACGNGSRLRPTSNWARSTRII